ncbi:MAG: hypothetical protein NTV34_02215 [Proteobacteria bacterium]|nr:hypothetical protein [Pseudomonadota bacterium]
MLSLVTAGIMGAAANDGGKIRHPEINPALRIELKENNKHDG